MSITEPGLGLSYGKVIGRFVAIVGDSASDSDFDPDVMPLQGTITFTPSTDWLKMAGAQPVPVSAAPVPITATLDESGYLAFDGNQYIFLIATDSTASNPTGFTYTVTSRLTLGGAPVQRKSFSISVPTFTADGDEVDLTLAAPVSESGGVQTIVGPAGAAATVAVGSTTTGAPGTAADVSNVGTTSAAVLDFVIPKGDKGDPGADGGIQTIVAGAGITVDATDPSNPKVSASGAVSSVNGKTGDVTLTASDVGAYVKPAGGIPSTDMTAAVQASLGSADSAVQPADIAGFYTKPGTGIPKTDLDSTVQTSLGKADTALQSQTPVASTDITDATTTGRALLTAADAAAGRTAIGAGTSNVVVGTGSGQAADAAATSTALAAKVAGPPSSVAGHLATYADATGKVVADGGPIPVPLTRTGTTPLAGIWTGTAAEYSALTPDSATLYVVAG